MKPSSAIALIVVPLTGIGIYMYVAQRNKKRDEDYQHLMDDLAAGVSTNERAIMDVFREIAAKTSQPYPELADDVKKIYAAMYGTAIFGWIGWGTDEDTLYAVFSSRNKNQLKALMDQYYNSYSRNLPDDLLAELEEEELANIKNVIK